MGDNYLVVILVFSWNWFIWFFSLFNIAFSALTLLVGQQEVHTACKKTEWWGAGVVICLERCVDLHMAQLMPLPLTVSCSSKIQIGFTFLVPAHLCSPGQRAVKRVCVVYLIITVYLMELCVFEVVITQQLFAEQCNWVDIRFIINQSHADTTLSSLITYCVCFILNTECFLLSSSMLPTTI